jgi:5-methylcytosine-specific restriction enzyme A
MPKRKGHSQSDRRAILKSGDGKCHICSGPITGDWEVEHVIPLAMGGSDELANKRPAHAKCHRSKTNADLGNLAKAKRREAIQLNVKADKPKIPQRQKPERIMTKAALPRRPLYEDAT